MERGKKMETNDTEIPSVVMGEGNRWEKDYISLVLSPPFAAPHPLCPSLSSALLSNSSDVTEMIQEDVSIADPSDADKALGRRPETVDIILRKYEQLKDKQEKRRTSKIYNVYAETKCGLINEGKKLKPCSFITKRLFRLKRKSKMLKEISVDILALM